MDATRASLQVSSGRRRNYGSASAVEGNVTNITLQVSGG
jgi:hypothetical protein